MAATKTLDIDDLVHENEELRRRLDETADALRALRAGEVDAVVVEEHEQDQVYTLENPDKPYRLLVEQMPHAAASLTTEGIVLYCNERFAELFGQPAAALRGAPFGDLAAPESRPRVEAMVRDACAAGAAGAAPVRGEVLLPRPGGTTTPVYLGITALREGALGQCLIVTDLTEQRRYEELRRTQAALRRSEARLADELADAKLLQQISAHLIQEDNVEALYQRLVEAASALLRSDMASMQILHPESNELELLAWQGFHPESAAFWKRVRLDSETSCGEALRKGQRVIVPDVEACPFITDPADIEANRRSGIRGVQSTPLISRTGQLLGMISTHWRWPHRPSERDLGLVDVLARQAADLIERKQAEQALRDADRRKDEFLATLAHELRNPLAPIRNAVKLLKAKGPPTPELIWGRDVIDRQVQLMARLLEDLLDVSRIARNKLVLRREPVELAGVIETALETSRPALEAGGHQLAVVVPSEPMRLEADAVRLSQVFANLLNNAAKFTPAGGRIELTAERQGSDAVVSVKDNGIGIAPATLPRIFEIYSQEVPALDRAQDGLGIGLSLVKGLVELHGGSVEARSGGPGRGSEFIVRLPITITAPSRQPAETGMDGQQQGVAAAPRRILIVDDNRDSADSLAKLLSLMGHEVGVAYDGAQAVRDAETLRPDLVLLDIGMPKLNGYDACCAIREQPWGRNMFLVALTGWGQEEDRRRTEEAGFNEHMVKPVDPDAIVKLLASLPVPQAS